MSVDDESSIGVDGLSDDMIKEAVTALGRGALVVIPTETVYGLAADVSQIEAVSQVFSVKSRPLGHPLIVHLSKPTQLDQWAHSISDAAWSLAHHFWPGPLTLILNRKDSVSSIVTGGQPTVGIRIPNHPKTLKLLQMFSRHSSGAVVAPSANRFGKISPTTVNHARDELGDLVDVYLDGGPCQIGIESTIVDVSDSGSNPRILRPGMISAQDIADVLGVAPAMGPSEGPAIRVSGCLASHYAPATPLKLIESQEFHSRLAEWLGALEHTASPVIAVLGFDRIEMRGVFSIQAEPDPRHYARNLYAWLRQLDAVRCRQILVQSPPQTEAWRGICDRLQRASVAKMT